MNVVLKKLKPITIISVLLTLILLLLVIIYPDINWIVISGLISFCISVVCLYMFFISSDINKEKIYYFKYLNRIGLLIAVLLFIYWGLINSNPYGLAIVTKILILVLFNLIIMTIIKVIIKKERKTLLKEWAYFILLLICFIIWGIIKKGSR